MSHRTRGALIAIEGLDRAGKSTQCERLCQHLEQQGHSVKRLRFPDRSTPIGTCINAYLRNETQHEDHSIHLLFSANRWEAAAGIRADIAAGTTVVIDRYYYSGVVYSAAKSHAGISLQWAREPEVGLPQPDVCVFLDIEPEVARRRGGFGEERYEGGEMQRRVRAGFYELMKGEDGEDIRVVNAGNEKDDVEGDIWKIVNEVIRDRVIAGTLRTIMPWEQKVAVNEGGSTKKISEIMNC